MTESEMLRIIRKRTGLSIEEIGNMIGVTRGSVRRYLNGSSIPVSKVIKDRIRKIYSFIRPDGLFIPWEFLPFK